VIALHGQLKGDFKQRKKSTLSKPEKLIEIQCGWKINAAARVLPASNLEKFIYSSTQKQQCV